MAQNHPSKKNGVVIHCSSQTTTAIALNFLRSTIADTSVPKAPGGRFRIKIHNAIHSEVFTIDSGKHGSCGP